MEFVVNRKTWLRGRGLGTGCLLNEEGEKCCLGFLASACGYEDCSIKGSSFLNDLPNQSKLPEEIRSYILQNVIADLNDGAFLLSEELREKAVTEKFAEIGITVRFKD